jgi:hypothetical protein
MRNDDRHRTSFNASKATTQDLDHKTNQSHRTHQWCNAMMQRPHDLLRHTHVLRAYSCQYTPPTCGEGRRRQGLAARQRAQRAQNRHDDGKKRPGGHNFRSGM